MDNTEIGQRLERFFARARPAANAIRIDRIKRFFGGSSKPTYRFDLHYRDRGEDRVEGLVVRLTPEASLVDHSRDNEGAILAHLHRRGFAVPAIAEIVTDASVLGAPFFLMEEIAGCESSPHALKVEPFAAHRAALGQQKWTLLGTLARYALTEQELAEFPETSAETAWLVELDKWTLAYRRHQSEPEPLVDRVLRWLRANPPPPAQKLSFVHGDYRTGNFLYNRDGQLRAVLDWEMAHAGDPHEDIAWAICPTWGWPDANRPGFLITRDEAFGIWEQTSGLRIDPQALHWWSLFSTVKGIGLWTACAHNVMQNGSLNAIEFAACWFPRDCHLRLMAELLFAKVP